MLKNNKKSDSKKEYIVIIEKTHYIPSFLQRFETNETDRITFFMNKNELITFIKENGNKNVYYISKNNKVDIEQIVNVKEN